MEVTYLSNSRVLGHSPGKIYKATLSPQLHAILLKGKHLTLIDPPTVEELDGRTTGATNPKKRTKTPRPDRTDRTEPESRQRLGDSPSTSSPLGRVEIIYGWESGSDGGGQTSEQPEEDRSANNEKREADTDIQ